MRFVVFGAGAIGGVVGGRLAQHNYDVVCIARPEQVAAIRENGLRMESPEGSTTVRVPVVTHPADVEWTASDVVLLTVKSQSSLRAVEDLASVVPPDIPVVCMQNGVENERTALRWFPNVYGVCVVCPATYLIPGVVEAAWSPTTGILDIGRYPSGTGEHTAAIARALQTCTFLSEPRPDIMRWKYGKLLMSLGNSVGALCGPSARSGPIAAMARQEALTCFKAAGIEYVSEAEDASRRSALTQTGVIAAARPMPRGGSSWQSLQRQTATIESGYLNGEIALLGRLHHIPTPANVLLQQLATRMARERKPPGSISPEDLLALIESARDKNAPARNPTADKR